MGFLESFTKSKMFLTDAEEKKSYKIVKIEEGKGIKLKLSSMGLLPGKIVKIVKNDFSGPIILAIKTGRISVGRGLSKKIQVLKL
jgi:ferrous iron transport protein A